MKKVIMLCIGILLIALTGCQSSVLTNTTNASTLDDLNSILYSANADGKTVSGIGKSDSLGVANDDKAVVDDTKASLPTKKIKEGEFVQFKRDLAYDPDGDKLIYTFSSPLNANGSWQTVMGDAGDYVITVKVSDGKLDSSQKVRLIVEAINRLPQISGFSDITVKEGEEIAFSPKVTDADGDELKLTYSGWMTKSSYKTTYDDAGTYQVTLSADDGKQIAEKTVSVIVEDQNRVPVLGKIESLTLTEGDQATLTYEASDPDGDAVSVQFGKPFDTAGSWATKIGDAGVYDVTVTASDGIAKATQEVRVTVAALNRAPVIELADSLSFTEGDLIELNPLVTDADDDSIKLTYRGFMKSSSYQTTFDDAGTYNVTVAATDGKESVEKVVEIVIADENRPPEFGKGPAFE